MEKIKFKDLEASKKRRIKGNIIKLFISVAVICVVLSGCFACSNEPASPSLSPEQKAAQQKAYWTAAIMESNWSVQTDTHNNGILKGNAAAMDIGMTIDDNTGSFQMEYQIGPEMTLPMGSLVLSSCDGTVSTVGGDSWAVHFSESNSVKYMTVTDSDKKTVYYKLK